MILLHFRSQLFCCFAGHSVMGEKRQPKSTTTAAPLSGAAKSINSSRSSSSSSSSSSRPATAPQPPLTRQPLMAAGPSSLMIPELFGGTAGHISLSVDNRRLRGPSRMGSFLNPGSNWRERVGEALDAMGKDDDIGEGLSKHRDDGDDGEEQLEEKPPTRYRTNSGDMVTRVASNGDGGACVGDRRSGDSNSNSGGSSSTSSTSSIRPKRPLSSVHDKPSGDKPSRVEEHKEKRPKRAETGASTPLLEEEPPEPRDENTSTKTHKKDAGVQTDKRKRSEVVGDASIPVSKGQPPEPSDEKADAKADNKKTTKASSSKRKRGEISDNFVRLNLKRKGTTRYRKVKISKRLAR